MNDLDRDEIKDGEDSTLGSIRDFIKREVEENFGEEEDTILDRTSLDSSEVLVLIERLNEKIDNLEWRVQKLEEDQGVNLPFEEAFRKYESFLEQARVLAKEMMSNIKGAKDKNVPQHIIVEQTDDWDIKYGVKVRHTVTGSVSERLNTLKIPANIKRILNEQEES